MRLVGHELDRVFSDPWILEKAAPGRERVALSDFPPGTLVIGEPDTGAGLFIPTGRPGEYYGHYAFTSQLRGPTLVRAARRILGEVFTYYGFVRIIGLTPRDNRAARSINRALGFIPTGRTVLDAQGLTCGVYIMEREQWERGCRMS